MGKARGGAAARDLASELDLKVRVVGPGAIVDSSRFEPPGRLGKRIANLFVAVGNPGARLAVVELQRASDLLVRLVRYFDVAPPVLHLLDLEVSTRRQLVDRLRKKNPGLRVLWLPRPLISPLSGLATLAQKLMRPRRRTVSLRRIFAYRPADASASHELWSRKPVDSLPGPDSRAAATSSPRGEAPALKSASS